MKITESKLKRLIARYLFENKGLSKEDLDSTEFKNSETLPPPFISKSKFLAM